MYSCQSIVECCGLFSGVKLSVRSFVLYLGRPHRSYLVESKFLVIFYLISLKHLQVNVAHHHEMGAKGNIQ